MLKGSQSDKRSNAKTAQRKKQPDPDDDPNACWRLRAGAGLFFSLQSVRETGASGVSWLKMPNVIWWSVLVI